MIFAPLLAITWSISPEIIVLKFFGVALPLTWYGLLFTISFILGQQLLLYIFRREGKSATDVEQLTLYGVTATVIGARLGHFLFYEWPLLLVSPGRWFTDLITPPFAGLASHGAIISILLALYVYSRNKPNQPFLWVVDRVVIPVSIGGVLIRLGNLFNSEIYGTPTTLPWGFVFLRENDLALLPLVPRHPTQLYESLFSVGLLGLTFYLWMYRRKILPNGFITGVFLVLLFSFRFFVEFLKNDQTAFEGDMQLNMGQLLSIPAVLLGFVVLLTVKSKALADELPQLPEQNGA